MKPDPGGWLDQDEKLMAEISVIAHRHLIVKEHIKVNDELKKKGEG